MSVASDSAADAPRVVYGGTFDPVHRGHVAVAELVATALESEVALLPAADPPHRPAPGADAAQRVAMLRLAIAGHPRLRIDPRELGRAGASYSVDTLAELRAEIGPRRPLVWVIGADALAGLDRWKDWRRLFGLAHFLAVERGEHPLASGWLAAQAPAVAAELAARQGGLADLRAQPAGRIAVLQPPQPLPESASEVRRRLADGGDWQCLLPPAVAAYITRFRLYGAGGV